VVFFFKKSIDTSDVIKDRKKMYELLDNIVDEIGKKHVVQVVRDCASNLMAAEKCYWKMVSLCI